MQAKVHQHGPGGGASAAASAAASAGGAGQHPRPMPEWDDGLSSSGNDDLVMPANSIQCGGGKYILRAGNCERQTAVRGLSWTENYVTQCQECGRYLQAEGQMQ